MYMQVIILPGKIPVLHTFFSTLDFQVVFKTRTVPWCFPVLHTFDHVYRVRRQCIFWTIGVSYVDCHSTYSQNKPEKNLLKISEKYIYTKFIKGELYILKCILNACINYMYVINSLKFKSIPKIVHVHLIRSNGTRKAFYSHENAFHLEIR